MVINNFGLIKNRTNINDGDNTFVQAGISVILDTVINVMILSYYLIYLIEEQLRKNNCVITLLHLMILVVKVLFLFVLMFIIFLILVCNLMIIF